MMENTCGAQPGTIVLHGNIAGGGIQTDLRWFPETMHCFRGAFTRAVSVLDAVHAVERGEVEGGSALAILPETAHTAAGDYGLLAQAIREHELTGRVCVILDEAIDLPGGGAAVFWFDGYEARRRSGIELLQNGDLLEYDLRARQFNADLTQEGYDARLSGQSAGAVVTELGHNTWAITEKYSRMFLLKGEHQSLLIDTAFGGVPIGEITVGLCGQEPMVALTHGHWDHCGGIGQFRQAYLSPEDFSCLPQRRTDAQGETYSGACRMLPLTDGRLFELGGRTVEAITCPGHTKGGVAFLDRTNRILFAGDTVAVGPTYLFMGECSAQALLQSLNKLERRGDAYDRIFSAHRQMQLDQTCIDRMRRCVLGALSGELTGETACIRKTTGVYQKYSYDGVSVFL